MPCRDCNQISECGQVLSSSCVQLNRSFDYSCGDTENCFPTLEDLLQYYKPIICQVKSDTDLSSLDRSCYTSAPNTGITVVSVFQEIINTVCGAYDLIESLTNSLNNYIPDYQLSTLNFSCLEMDPCVTTSLTLKTLLQNIIYTICNIKTTNSALQALYDSLPYQYNIDWSKYTCITHDLGKSDVENLFVKVNEICASYGSKAQIANALTYDQIGGATTIASTITNLWLSIIALQSGGGSGGGSQIFDSYFSITGNVVSINCNNLKSNCITPDYIRSQFTEGPGIDITNGVISATPVTLSTDTNSATVNTNGVVTIREKRVLFYESGLALVSSDDIAITYVSKTIGDTVLTLPINPLVTSGSTPGQIHVSKINGTGYRKYIPGTNYTLNPARNQITLVSALIANDIIEVSYF